MKKNLLTIFTFVALGTIASAQITLIQWDVASVNTMIRQANDTLPTIGPGAAGTNVTWNLLGLNNHTVDTLLFTNPNWTPYGVQYPTANLAAEFGMNSGTYAYLKNQANGLYIVGQAGDFGFGPMVVQMNPNEQLISFPCTYNSSFNGISKLDVTIPFTQQPPLDSVRFTEKKTKTSMCDGWGNLTTPLGLFPALRLKEYNITIDSVWGHIPILGWQFLQETVDTNYHFAWWAQSVGFPVVEMDSALDGTISGVTWLMATPSPGGFAEYNSVNNISFYPNPANTSISFNLSKVDAAEVKILDATGKLVSSLIVTNEIETADVSKLANGIYFYTVVDKNGTAIGTGKFNIAK